MTILAASSERAAPGGLAQVVARWAPIGVAAAVGLFVFVFYWRAIEHRWYAGAFLYDFGWFNDLVGGRTLDLSNPSGIGVSSYYAVHVAPLLSGFALISRSFGLHGVQPLTLMLSLAFGGAASAAFLILRKLLEPIGLAVSLIGGAAGALIYALSGLMRAVADYPHIEILYVPLALAALYLIFQGRTRWAWLPFCLCLLAREDSGLHLSCILGGYLVLAAIDARGIPARLRAFAPFLLAALVYPGLAILWQRTAFDGASTFQQIYTGVPPYAHLTRALLSHRAHLMFGEMAWVTLTLVTTLCVAPFRPRAVAFTGALASLPWLLLNITALSMAAGELRLYYAFPFLVTALTPLIIAAAPEPDPREDRLDVVAF